MHISLVIPAYNEAKNIKNCVENVEQVLKELDYIHEIIITEDGSIDGTDVIVSKLVSKNKKIRHLHSDLRRGKGKAIKDAFRVATGNILIFLDADLSTDVSRLPSLIKGIKNGADICIGSRHLKSSKIERSFLRSMFSKSYNLLVRILFKTKIKDFQCGFKAFKRDLLPFLIMTKSNDFFWDTEILLLAERMRLKISQIPIEWKERKKSKINLIKNPLKICYELFKLRLNFPSINIPKEQTEFSE